MEAISKEVMSGQCLHGDDMLPEDIAAWFADEEYGYFELAGDDQSDYGYNALNDFHGFRALPDQKFNMCVALGCAGGQELEAIAQKVSQFYCIEPAEKWWRSQIGGTPAIYLKPTPKGVFPLHDGQADLATAFGVLHHIPNVSTVIGEFARILRPGGYLVLREPCHSMGDWRHPRRGLTRRERGISAKWLREALSAAGFEIVRSRPVMFSLSSRLFPMQDRWNRVDVVIVDWLLSTLFAWNVHYWRRNAAQKLAPTSTFLVVRKR